MQGFSWAGLSHWGESVVASMPFWWVRTVAGLGPAGGDILLVSQFTLFASTKKGTRPSWHRAAKPETAESLYQAMALALETRLGRSVAKGRFGAMMQVALVNEGPVTILIDSRRTF